MSEECGKRTGSVAYADTCRLPKGHEGSHQGDVYRWPNRGEDGSEAAAGSQACSGGLTHHFGCECWERQRNDRLARLEAEVRILRQQLEEARNERNRIKLVTERGMVARERKIEEALAPFRALASAYPHEVDGWLVTHTEPGLTLGDVRRLVREGR